MGTDRHPHIPASVRSRWAMLTLQSPVGWAPRVAGMPSLVVPRATRDRVETAFRSRELPEPGGDQLGEVAVRVTEVEALRPAGPGHDALDGHALGFEAALPRLHIVG